MTRFDKDHTKEVVQASHIILHQVLYTLVVLQRYDYVKEAQMLYIILASACCKLSIWDH